MKNKHFHKYLKEYTDALAETYFKDEVPVHNLEPRYVLPSRRVIIATLKQLFEVFYPGYIGKQYLTRSSVSYYIGSILDEVAETLHNQIYAAIRHEDSQMANDREQCSLFADNCIEKLIAALPTIRRRLTEDVAAGFDGDPAAKNYNEIIFSYPGLVAITTYRVAHELEYLNVPLLPRIMSEWAHSRTGIDIHPGAEIGNRFFIDHGTGVVVGETTIIGSNVKLYQGVTLGALSFPKDERGKLIRGLRRHPKIGDNVIIYSGATILGDVTIGADSIIGGNVWLTKSVEPKTRVINTPQIPNIRKL